MQLSHRNDFNLFDAFRIFDLDGKGYLTHYDLRAGLNDIGVHSNNEELDLFFARYDKNQDKIIRFSEFCDAFTPLDSYYGSLLNRRSSNNRPSYYKKDDCFNPTT